MGKLFLHIGRFLVVTVVLYVGTMAVLAYLPVGGTKAVYRTGSYYVTPGGPTWVQFKEYDRNERYDAVIIGSSHAYRGYDPEVFAAHGHRVFNLGSSGQTPLNTYWLIKTLLDSVNAPLLIMDVYTGTFISTGLESTADLVRNQPSNAAALGMVWSLRDLRGVNLFALRTVTPNLPPERTAKAYRGSGFTPHVDSIKTEAGPPTAEAMVLAPRQMKLFEDCLALCKERGIKVVLSSHYARRDRREQFHQPLAQYLDSTLDGTGIRYLDFTATAGIDDRNWFADGNHLNLAGARIFTNQLVDSLETLGYLPNGH